MDFPVFASGRKRAGAINHMTSVLSPSRLPADEAKMLAVAIAVAAFLCLFFHGYEIFQYNLSIDEELMLQQPDLLRYVRLGRWGAFFFSWLKAPIPVMPMVGGLVFYSAAFVLLIRRLDVRHWQSICVAAVFYFGFPTLLYAYAFSNLTLGLGFGTLLCVLVVYVAGIRTAARFLLAAFGVAFVTAMYQTLLFFLFSVVLADIGKRLLDEQGLNGRAMVSYTLWYGGILICGLLLYGLIYFSLLTYFNQSIEYLPNYFAPEKLSVDPILIGKITLDQIWKIYSAHSPIFVGYKQPYRLMALVIVAILAAVIIASGFRRPWMALGSALLLVGIVGAPFLQHPFNGGEMPYRTLVAVPAAVALLGLFAAERTSDPIRNWLLLPLTVLVAFQFSAINNKQYFAGHWALERDKFLGMQILSRIQEIAPDEAQYRIAVVGQGPVNDDVLIPNVPSSTLGASFFRWDAGNYWRIVAFLNFLTPKKISAATPDEVEKAFQTATTMPSWPHAGSIARSDRTIIIKLSEPTRWQVVRFCQQRTSEFCKSALVRP
jgi:hypothetical protein